MLAAARGAYPGRRLVLAFQPHRYTRTRDCFVDFARVMKGADVVLLTEVYSAGEAPIEGVQPALHSLKPSARPTSSRAWRTCPRPCRP